MAKLPGFRRNWRLNWLGSIREFADYSAQRRHWLDLGNENPHFSYVEYMCSYFDDLDLSQDGYSSALSEGLVSAREVDAIKDFHNAADAHSSPTNDYDHAAILNDPAWQEVVQLASIAKKRLQSLLVDPNEVSALNR